MTQEALISFLCQDHSNSVLNRVLTVVNDGEPGCLTLRPYISLPSQR